MSIEKELARALERVLEAWDYNGGGDSWCRECYGEDISKARGVLDAFKRKARDPQNLSSAPRANARKAQNGS